MTLTAPQLTDSQCIAAIAARIDEFFDEKESRAHSYGSHYAQLWAAARRSSQGGKRFRPALVVNVYHALGGNREEDVVVVASAFELLHTAFLLHDDVIDGDSLRRGRPNLLGEFTEHAAECGLDVPPAATWGQAAAILAGDLLLHSAHSQVARLSIADHQRAALLDLFEECMFVSAAGELADVAFSTTVQIPVLSEVLSMTQWKTAHYSFQAPLRAGAMLAGASEATVGALSEYGRNIGIAFQLRDDILGVFGAENVTGKSAVSDLREGKITPLMCCALQRDESGELRDILSHGDASGQDAHRARQILESSGARAFVEDLIADYMQLASAAIDSPAVPARLREQLAEVALKAHERAS